MSTEIVGSRVTIRYRVEGTGPSGGPAMSDAVGHVRQVTDDDIVVEHRSGTMIRVARNAIVVIKKIPPRP